MHIRVAGLISAVLLVLAGFLLVQANCVAQPQDFDIPNGHFFTQTGGGGEKGFAVTDDDGIPLWTEFQRLGGVQAVGFPISRRFVWNGLLSQAFQRVIFQWQPGRGVVAFVNTFDLMSSAGLDDFLLSVRQGPKPVAFGESGNQSRVL